MLVGCVAASAQHHFGFRAGYGSGSMGRIFPPQEMGTQWGLYNAGVAWKYYSREKYLGGVEADLQFIQKGYQRPPDPAKPDTVYARTVNSVEVPLFWQPHIYLMGRNLRVFLNAGVVFSYNLSSKDHTFSKRDGVIEPWRDYQLQLTRDNRWGYGLCAGFGINYISGRLEWLAEARYNIGYSDILRNNNKYEGNPQRSPLDNLYFSVGAFYRVGKGGILSEPSKRVAAKMAEREAARALRDAEKLPPPEAAASEPAPESAPQEEQIPKTDGIDPPTQSSQTDTERPE
jgi:hypothetical protein